MQAEASNDPHQDLSAPSRVAKVKKTTYVNPYQEWNVTDRLDCYAFEDGPPRKKPPKNYRHLDDCINNSYSTELCSIASLIRSRKSNGAKKAKAKHLKPLAFVRLNTRKGKPKPVTIRALLDSGGAGTLVSERYVAKLLTSKKSNTQPTVWQTPAGPVSTNRKVKVQFTLPEMQDDKLIEWECHVIKDLGSHDMILGRDLLEFLGIDIRFSDQTVEWGHTSMPFKETDAQPHDSYYIAEDASLAEASDRLKKILDAKYEAADLDEVVAEQEQLSSDEKAKLKDLLQKYASLFDGTLGKWKGSRVELKLKKDANPFHAKAFSIPRCHVGTLKLEVERLCKLGVLRKVNRSQWAAPTFVIPKKDGSVRFISDFRELNKRILRQPYPIPHIQDMLLNLEGFKYATSLDLNMGYYHLELSPESKRLCTIVLPFGKYEYQRIPMGLCNSPDIFQEKMNELFEGLDFVRAYIDDLLCLTKGTFEDHLEKLERVFVRLQQAGLKVNAKKSFFAKHELEYLGYWITREGIQPVAKKVEAMLKIAEPKTRKQLRSFIGVVNYYRDMWVRRSHVLAPLARLTSTSTKWEWGPKEAEAFRMAKKIIAKEALLAYPDFNKPFVIHTDASHYQLGGVISQEGKPIAFYSRKLNDAQTRYTTTERELLSIVETLKEYRNILLGQKIVVHTDHKNLVYKHFNTERVMRWRLILEEFGPELRYIKGENNIVADTLSRLDLSEEDFSADCFAGDIVEYPLRYPEVLKAQQKDKGLKKQFQDPKSTLKTSRFRHSDKFYDLICTADDKIVLPRALQKKAVQWYHQYLLHPGETRMELTIGQHYYWKSMRTTIQQVCRDCDTCTTIKKSNKQRKRGLLPPKQAETIPWHTLCIDLIGPYTFGYPPKKKGEPDNRAYLHCLTMIDPATGWFEIVEIPSKRADYISNYLEITWLSRYPWPTEIVMDRGREFAAEVATMLKEDYGIHKKLITTRNPQANAIVERVHKEIHSLVATMEIKDKRDLDDHFGWTGILSAVRAAVRATVHTTTRATPSQLVFGRDAVLNCSFEANWQYIKDRKQRLIDQNNKKENARRVPHVYSVGDKVTIRLDPNRKHGVENYSGPHTITAVNDNGTVQLSRVAYNGGAVRETWHIRNLDPCLA